MIGNSLLRNAEVVIKNGEAFFKELVEKNLLEEFSSICLNAEELKLDIPIVELSRLKKDVAGSVVKEIEEYKPKKNVKSPIEMKIVLKDDRPVYQQPRRIPFADRAIVDAQISEWLKEKIIQPSTSEYASPVVLVAKKDGSKRLCCDYRKLNEKIIRDHFPMPLIDEVLDRLQSASVYTT